MTAKDKIINSFFNLLSIKEFNDISISEICNVAEVHRTTFYAYYNNLYELLLDAKDYANNIFKNSFKPNTEIKEYLSYDVLVPYFNFLKQYPNLFKAYLKNSNMFNAKDDFDKIYKTYFLTKAHEYGAKDDKAIERIVKFYMAGMETLIIDWLDEGCKDDPEDIAKIIVGIRYNSEIAK